MDGTFWLAMANIAALIAGYFTLRYKASMTYVQGLEARLVVAEQGSIDCHTKQARLEVKFAATDAELKALKESSKEAASVAAATTTEAVDALKETQTEALHAMAAKPLATKGEPMPVKIVDQPNPVPVEVIVKSDEVIVKSEPPAKPDKE